MSSDDNGNDVDPPWTRRAAAGGLAAVGAAALAAPLLIDQPLPPLPTTARRNGLRHVAVSPNGEVIAFVFSWWIEPSSPVRYGYGVGLYDLSSQRIRRIRNPLPRTLGSPSFHHSGFRLCCTLGWGGLGYDQAISVVDLPGQATSVIIQPQQQAIRGNAVFLPDSDRLVMSEGPVGHRHPVDISAYEADGTRAECIMSEEEGFRGVRFLQATGPLRVIFSGYGPVGSPRCEMALQTARPSEARPYWEAEFGQRPRMLCWDLTGLASTPNGSMMVGFTRKGRWIHCNRHGFEQHLVRIDRDGVSTPLMELGGWPQNPAISADGETVAFLNDPSRDFERDIIIFRRSTGVLRTTGLRERIALLPEFGPE